MAQQKPESDTQGANSLPILIYKTFCRYGRDNCDIEIARQRGRYYVLKIYNVLKKSSLA